MKNRSVWIILVAILAGCERPAPEAVSTTEVRAGYAGKLPSGPEDAAWDKAVPHPAALMLQNMVEPRKLKASTPEVRVQALTDGRSVAFRLSWKDATKDDVRSPATFTDACAVQMPQSASPDLPAPQMGEPGRPVQISYWSAAAQAAVEGRPDDIQAFHPHAKIDHYPFTAAPLDKNPDAKEAMARLYAPSRALGNISAGIPRKPVQDLLATGPGSLAPVPEGSSDGQGRRDAAGWKVVISRPLPQGLTPGGRSHVAFAVWNGSDQDAGSRKMWTGWIPLAVGSEGKNR